MSLITQWLESLADKIEINDQCLREISPFSKCKACIEVCEEDALKIVKGKIVVNESNCTGCGECMTTCPAYAIDGLVPLREVINDTLLYKKERAPSVREWLYYYHKGVRIIAVEKEQLNEQWEESLKEANEYLVALDRSPLTVTDETPQVEEKGYTRRQLFRQFTEESKSVVLKSFTPAKWRFNNSVFSYHVAFPEWAFYEVTIDEERCNLCEVCFKVCPQKVFTVENNELLIDQSKCTGCGLCPDVCQEDAITFKEYIQPKRVDELVVYEHECPQCKLTTKQWSEEPEVCFVCEKRKGLLYLK